MEKQKRISIGLIDDQKMLLKSLSYFFEYHDFQVVLQAESGQCAIERMEKLETNPDICILDINMPIMDGFETAGKLAEQYPELKILAFSSDSSRNTVERIMGLGVKGFVVKGSDLKELKAAAEMLYEGHSYFSTEVRSFALGYLAKQSLLP